jgi:hypothetical protein
VAPLNIAGDVLMVQICGKVTKPLKKDDDVLMVKMKHNKKTILGIKNHPDQLKVQFDYKQNGNQIPNLRYVNI